MVRALKKKKRPVRGQIKMGLHVGSPTQHPTPSTLTPTSRLPPLSPNLPKPPPYTSPLRLFSRLNTAAAAACRSRFARRHREGSRSIQRCRIDLEILPMPSTTPPFRRRRLLDPIAGRDSRMNRRIQGGRPEPRLAICSCCFGGT